MKTPRHSAALVSLLVLTTGGASVLADDFVRRSRIDRSPVKGFQYVVTTLCNGPENSPLARAAYKTVTNIANANDKPTLVRFDSKTPGEPQCFGDFELEAFEVEPLGVKRRACPQRHRSTALPADHNHADELFPAADHHRDLHCGDR